MTIYLINLIVVITALIICKLYNDTKKRDVLSKSLIRYDYTNNIFFKIICFCILFFELAFVGDFTTDMKQYYLNYMYNYGDIQSITASQIINSFIQQGYIGFSLVNMVVKNLFGEFLVVLIIFGFIIAEGYSRVIFKYSDIAWISMVVLLCSGSYYQGFNILRQILAVGMFCFCMRFIWEGQFKKFLISILFISTFHFSSLILIPFHFVLRSKILMKVKQTQIIVIAIVILFYLWGPSIIGDSHSLFYQNRLDSNAYELNQGLPIQSLIKALIIGGVIMINANKFNLSDTKELVVFNGAIMYLIFAAVGAQIFIAMRFSHFFIPFIMIAYPIMVNRINGNRSIVKILILILFIFLDINRVLGGDYSFFWDNTVYTW